MELDPDYKWALVGSRTENYLWILSRTPKMDPAVYDKLVVNAKKRGYDISKLTKVQQK
jgi:lipocalin